MERSKLSLIDRLITGELDRNYQAAQVKLRQLRETDPEAEKYYLETLNEFVNTDDLERKAELVEDLANSTYYNAVGAELDSAGLVLFEARRKLKRRQSKN
jgi:hypothetical protein